MMPSVTICPRTEFLHDFEAKSLNLTEDYERLPTIENVRM